MTAYAAACSRALYLGTGPTGARFFCSTTVSELAKPNSKRPVLFDTLSLVRRLEKRCVPTKHAEAMTELMSEVLNESIGNVLDSFVSKGEMQKLELSQESNVSNFKTEVKSSQDHHFSLLEHETQKLKSDIEKMRSELRYEIDKVTAGLRLDLNLERRRVRDELNNQSQVTNNLTTKIDKEIRTLRAQLEAAKYDVIKYCVGTLASISVIGLAVLRLLL